MKQYKEVVWSPAGVFWKNLALSALALFLLFPVGLRLCLAFHRPLRPVDWITAYGRYLSHPPFWLLIPMFLPVFFTVLMAHRISIRIRDDAIWLPPTSRYEKRFVPLADIVICRIKPYDYQEAKRMGRRRREGNTLYKTIFLPGYSGDGIEIGFFTTNFSPKNLVRLLKDGKPRLEKTLVRVHFPCRDALLLAHLINTGRTWNSGWNDANSPSDMEGSYKPA